MNKHLFIIIIVFSTKYLFAESSKYKVSGNTITQNIYVETLIKKCEEDTNLLELKQCLLNSRLFSEVTVEKKDKQINVNVKDRWSIIPIPFLSTNNEGKTVFGGFLMDGNFLGLGKTLVLGGTYASNSHSYFTLYSDKSLFFTPWVFTLMSTGGEFENKLKSKEEDEIDGFIVNSFALMTYLGYKFTPNLTFSAGIGVSSNDYDQFGSFDKRDDYNSFSLMSNLKYSNEKFHFYFNEGVVSHFRAYHEVYRNDEKNKVFGFDARMIYGIRMFSDHALQFGLAGTYVNGGDERSLTPADDKRGFRGIIDGGFWSDKSIVTSADYHVPVMSGSYGTWTVAPFADLGFISNVYKTSSSFVQRAVGVGTYYYLKKVMIPGLGFVCGRNMYFKGNFFNFFMGMSM
jgi:outer membrane protein assembly factor BamA